jgi:hypothetical protein
MTCNLHSYAALCSAARAASAARTPTCAVPRRPHNGHAMGTATTGDQLARELSSCTGGGARCTIRKAAARRKRDNGRAGDVGR